MTKNPNKTSINKDFRESLQYPKFAERPQNTKDGSYQRSYCSGVPLPGYKQGPGHGHSDWRLRAKAHVAVADAVRSGKLVRAKKCERCGAKPGRDSMGRPLIVGHHHNGYENPLDVQWLCATCNITIGSKSEDDERDEPLGSILEGGGYSFPDKLLRNLVWYGQPGYEAETAEIDKACDEAERRRASTPSPVA